MVVGSMRCGATRGSVVTDALAAAESGWGCSVPSPAAPPTMGASSPKSMSTTSATMQVMLSGPPPRSASSIIRSAVTFGSGVRMVSASVSSLTTEDNPSEQSR